MGFLGARFKVVGDDKIPPTPRLPISFLCLKLVRIMLETWKLVRKYTPICSSKNYTFSTKTVLIFLMLAFSCKKSAFFCINNTFTQINNVRAVLENF